MRAKIIKTLLMVAPLLTLPDVFATDYVFRELMANTLPSAKCAAEPEAVKFATKPYTMERYSKIFCRTQGYGWHVEQIKDQGRLVCDTCSSAASADGQRCHVEDVVVECKRIKPGTVGMLPGQG